MKGLSRHQCSTEQDGVDFLMMGNFLRQVEATQMNKVSSRSHCLFLISLEIEDMKSGKKLHAKINLGKFSLLWNSKFI